MALFRFWCFHSSTITNSSSGMWSKTSKNISNKIFCSFFLFFLERQILKSLIRINSDNWHGLHYHFHFLFLFVSFRFVFSSPYFAILFFFPSPILISPYLLYKYGMRLGSRLLSRFVQTIRAFSVDETTDSIER